MKIYRHFPAISLWGLFMILTLAVLCSCNKNLGSQQSKQSSLDGVWQPRSQESAQHSPDGVWHTGAYVRDVEPGEYKIAFQELDKYAYKMYRVCHDGSCGFRAFIPIMLPQLLEGGKWKKWMEDMKNTVFEPTLNNASYIENTKYLTLAATNDPEALYQETWKLFEHLAQEGAPRKLQEAEMQILVDFLRQTVLMHILISQPQKELEYLYSQSRKNNWWAHDDIFSWLGLPLPFYEIIVSGACNTYRSFDDNDTHRDTDTSGKSIFPQKGMVVLLHHDEIFFDYLVQQEG